MPSSVPGHFQPPRGLHLVASNLHARAVLYLDMDFWSLAHHGCLNMLAALVGVIPGFPRDHWHCFLDVQLCPEASLLAPQRTCYENHQAQHTVSSGVSQMCCCAKSLSLSVAANRVKQNPGGKLKPPQRPTSTAWHRSHARTQGPPSEL